MNPMMTVLAALVFALHLSWYVWVIFGALWTRNRPLLAGFHVLSLAWGIVMQVGLWRCPLTLIEQFLQAKMGDHVYASSFALHYLGARVNPRIAYSITIIGALIICVVNLSIYLVRLIRALGDRSQKLAMSLVTIAVVFMGSLLLRQTPVHGKLSLGLLHRFLRAAVVGSDGSQTGTASFQGNFTSISVPGLAVGLSRQADCSLTLLSGDYSLASLSFTQTVVSANYDRVLHSAAGLTTTPGVFASGCASPNTGISTRPIVYAGETTAGIKIYAAVSYNPMTGNNALYTMNLNTSSISIQDLATAGALTTADLNGDGNGDLVIVNSDLTTAGSVSVMLGNADGTFKTAVSYPTAGAGAIAAVVDDINSDGKLDIVVASDDQEISVLTGKGDGTFNSAQSFSAPLPGSSLPIATPIKHLITADINGDGKKDIICSNGLVLLGNGDGTFTASSTVAFPYVTGTTNAGANLASGDLNKDGKVDLVLATGTTISTWLGKGDGTFIEGNSYASIENSGYVAVTDLDGDGNLDIYSGLANGGYYDGDDTSPTTSYALMGNGDGTFVGAPSVSGSYNGSNIGDVNGDGYPDLIVPTSGTVNGQTAVFTVELGTPNGTFTPTSTITVPLTVTFSVSEFTSPVTENTSNLTPASYVVGDINGDGKADVAYVSNYRGYAVYFVALNNGDGTFAPAVATGFPQIAPSSGFDITTMINNLRIGDFNHDGKADLIFNFDDTAGPFGTGLYLQGLGVLPGNGAGAFGAPVLTYSYNSGTVPTSGGIPSVSSIVDLNGDGYPDLVATNGSFAVVNGVGVTTSTVQVYLGKVDGTFAAPTAAITTTYLGQLTVADFNKDGKFDIAALTETSAGQAQLSIALGNGDGTFAAPAISNLLGGDAIRSAGLASADFDGDGNVDLALFDTNDFSGVFYGKGDGTFTSVPFNGDIIPKDLVSLAAGGQAVSLDMNKDGKPDVIVGSTVLLNLYGLGPIAPKYATTATLTTSATTIPAGSSLTLTATITGASGSPAAPSGTITFLDGTTTLGTGTLASGVATLMTSTLPVGNHSITATYGGDANFNGSNSSAAAVTVTTVAAVATTTALSASPSTGVTGTSITLTATVTAASGTAIPTGPVNFLDGATTIGMGTLDPTGKGTFSTSLLAVGTHTIIANYVGTTGFAASTSNAASVSITLPVPDFALTISPSSGTETKTTPASATVSVTPANGFNSAVSFACSGLPSGVTCSFNPPTVTPTGTTASTTTVTFAGATSAANRGPLGHHVPETIFAVGLGAWLLTRRRINKLSIGLWTVLMAAALLNLAGCGSSGSKTTTSTVTITATSGALSHTASYSLAATK